MTNASAADLHAIIKKKLKVWLSARKKTAEVDQDLLDEALTAMEAFLEDVEERQKRAGDPATFKSNVGLEGLNTVPLGLLIESYAETLAVVEDEKMRDVAEELLEFLPNGDVVQDKLARMRKLVRAKDKIDDARLEKFIEALTA